MKKILFLLFSLPLSMGLFGQAKPPVNPAQVGTGLPADAGKMMMMDVNGRGLLSPMSNLVWQVGGNAVSANSIIGTTSAFDVIFRTNNINRLKISKDGWVGIGTDTMITPYSKLSIKGDHGNSRISLQSTGDGGVNDAYLELWASEPAFTYSGTGIGNNILGLTMLRKNTALGGSYIRMNQDNLLFHTVSNTGVNRNLLSLNTNGTIGIGGQTTIYGTTRVNGGDIFLQQPYGLLFANAQSVRDNSNGGLGLYTSTPNTHINLTPTGNVGIGTTSPSQKLSVIGGIRADIQTTGNSLILSGPGSNFQVKHDGGSVANVFNSGGELQMSANDGTTPKIRTTNGSNYLFGEQLFLATGSNAFNAALKNTGELGLGIQTPTNKLHVVGTNPARLEGLQTPNSTTDFLLTADATGVVRQRTVANLFTSAPIQTLQQITDAGGGATTGGLSAATVTTSTVGTTTNTNFNVMRQNVSRLTLLSTESRYYATATHTFETDLLSDPTLRLKNFSNVTNLFVNDKFTNVTTANGDIVLTPTGIAMKVGTTRKDFKFGQNARQNYRVKNALEIGGGTVQAFSVTDTTSLLRLYCNASDVSDAGNVNVYVNLPANPQNDAEIKVIAQNLFTSIVFQAGSGQTIANTATYYPILNDIYVLQFISTTEGSSGGTWIIKKQ
jgi:hypothetical protein